MRKLTEMKLTFSMLPIGKQDFNYHIDGKFFNEIETSEVRSGSVDVALSVTHSQEGIYELDFVCNGIIIIPCDRCLDDMEHPVDTSYHLTVKMGDELDESIDNVLVIPSSWRTLDLSPIVRDTVLLTIPMMHAHSPGDCNQEMLGRLMEHTPQSLDSEEDFMRESQSELCTTAEGETDPRWDALKQLLDNKEQ